MISDLALLTLSIGIGFPIVVFGAKVTLNLSRRMDAISRLSAWVGRVGTAVGFAVSILLGLAVLISGNGFFAPLATLGGALFVELVVASQLRNGIKVWERRDRGTRLVDHQSILRQIEERLETPGVSTIERAALRVQRSVLRWLKPRSVA
jgi:hypothetical protein